jgi:hypothetical protein
MCDNLAEVTASILTTAEPQLEALLNFEGILNTSQGQTIIAEYKQAEADLANWKPGLVGENIVEVLTDVNSAIEALPIPPEDKFLANVILAAVTGVIGVIDSHEPAAAATPPASIVIAAHAAATIASTTTQVQELVPEFKAPRFFSYPHEQKKVWKTRVNKLDKIYTTRGYAKELLKG